MAMEEEEEVRYLSAVGTWSGLPINSVAQRVKGGFTVRSVPWQESGRVLSVLGSAERRRGVGEEITGRTGDRGFVIEACYSAMGLLSAGGRLPQAEKSRDPGAHLPLPQVYDSAERDRSHDGTLSYWYKNPTENLFTKAL